MTKIDNRLIEFERMYSGTLTADNNSVVKGHRVFNKDGKFSGLYDKEHNAVWVVSTESLQFIK